MPFKIETYNELLKTLPPEGVKTLNRAVETEVARQKSGVSKRLARAHAEIFLSDSIRRSLAGEPPREDARKYKDLHSVAATVAESLETPKAEPDTRLDDLELLDKAFEAGGACIALPGDGKTVALIIQGMVLKGTGSDFWSALEDALKRG